MSNDSNQQPIVRLFNIIDKEKIRQVSVISLIASENYAHHEVLQASGSILTNKYAEGYPGRRYYGGCQVVDEIENEVRDLGKKLFNAEHINVQPHSGSSANFAAYLSQLNPGDTIVGMSIAAGGHLTHGHKVNFSGQMYNFIGYGVSPEDELLDYDEIEILVQQHQPKMLVAGASSYSRVIDFDRLAQIAKNNNALFLVDMAHIAGLVAAGVHPSPIPHADIITSTTHKTLRGPRGGLILSKADFAQSVDRGVFPGSQGGPLMHIIAAKGIAFAQAMEPGFKVYQQQVVKNSQAMVKEFKTLGYRIVSGGTDNHMFSVDLRSKNTSGALEKITGDIVEDALGKCSIVVNRNLIPFDPERPMVTSGMRLGTPAVTTRGFKEHDVKQVVHWINEAIEKRHDDQFLAALKEKVQVYCRKFPIYNESVEAK